MRAPAVVCTSSATLKSSFGAVLILKAIFGTFGRNASGTSSVKTPPSVECRQPSSHEFNTWNPPAPLSSPHPDSSQEPMPDPQKPAKDSKKPATVVENALAAPEKSPFKQTGLSFGDAPVAPADRIHPFFYVKKPAPRDDHNLWTETFLIVESSTDGIISATFRSLGPIREKGDQRSESSTSMASMPLRSSYLIASTICILESPKYAEEPLPNLAIKSRHDVDSIVDLAGTEGVKDVNMGVERKAEGQQINKGLEEVGRCLNSLIGSGPIVATSTFPNILRQNSGDRCRTA
ncbi:hypothetical protein E8E14_012357 [Neopestalotiopsis sp. 37M]|nr:hypothetical protein E8E14_012357 [Neopestalotiopsis sp. 37M]